MDNANASGLCDRFDDQRVETTKHMLALVAVPRGVGLNVWQ